MARGIPMQKQLCRNGSGCVGPTQGRKLSYSAKRRWELIKSAMVAIFADFYHTRLPVELVLETVLWILERVYRRS